MIPIYLMLVWHWTFHKKLVNAAGSIAINIDPNTIIGLIDTSILSNGKARVVFTRAEMYLKNNLDSIKK